MAAPSKRIKPADLENTLLCANWLIEEFEKMNLHSIAKLFQSALDDSVAWLNTISLQNNEIQKYEKSIKIREAQMIRDILVKYASIQDPEKRKKVLQKMKLATK